MSEAVKKNRRFGWAQLDVTDPLALQEIRRIGWTIAPEHLLKGEALEKDPHITVVYGLRVDDEYAYQGFSLPQVNWCYESMSVFRNPGCDVLKLAVHGPGVHYLRERMMQLRVFADAPQTYATYEPHITIAYLKRGCGKFYERLPLGNVRVLRSDSLTVHTRDRKQFQVRLNEDPPSFPKMSDKLLSASFGLFDM